MTELRALFFDFDGLIVDTETAEVEVWREVFREHGVEYPDNYWIHAIGRGVDQLEELPLALLQRLAGIAIDEAAVDADRHRRHMEKINAQPVRPGILRLADEAREAGLRVAVVSSSRHAWVDTHLDRLGIRERFETTICRDDVARAKPYPDLYLRACDWAGVSPSEAATLEDSPNGLHAANAAGVFGIAVPNPMTARLDLTHAGARIDDLGQYDLATLRALIASSTAG